MSSRWIEHADVYAELVHFRNGYTKLPAPGIVAYMRSGSFEDLDGVHEHMQELQNLWRPECLYCFLYILGKYNWQS